jgi:hypothetical protein
MFTKTLLTALLALMTYGVFSTPQEGPIPRCFPCEVR